MKKKLKITGLKLKTKNGQEVELTLDEAKELHDQLENLFGKEIVYVPSTPIVIERDRWAERYPPHSPWIPTWYSNHPTLCSISGDSGLTVSYNGKR